MFLNVIMNDILYRRIMHSVSNTIDLLINEAYLSERDMEHIAKYVENAITMHYEGLAHNNNKRAAIYYSREQKLSLNTCCDIKVNIYPSYYTELPFIKVCKRKGKNKSYFRVELENDGSDILNNNNPKYNVNCLAFIVENDTIDNEKHVYVLEKSLILQVISNLIELGAIQMTKNDKIRVNSNIKDTNGNYLQWYLKQLGIVLSNKFIKSKLNYVEKFPINKAKNSDFKHDHR